MTTAGQQAAPQGGGHKRLQWRILIGFLLGLVLGLAVYAGAPDAAWLKPLVTYVTNPVGQIFLRLLFMLVMPLLFSALVVGIAEMGEMRALKRVGLQTLGYTVVVSAIAVAVSLAVVNVLQPGAGVEPAAAQAMIGEAREGAAGIIEKSAKAKTGIDAIIGIIPSNPVTAMSENDILAVMFFALFFGIGLLLTQGPRTDTVKQLFEGVFEVSMRLIGLVIQLAPVAIFCFMFNLAAQFGWDLIIRLAAYVGVVLLALAIQMFLVYPAILATLARKNPFTFFRETQEATMMAFATSSSNATLPTALRVAETRLNLPPRIARFVLTIGATANQNGTAMFEGVTVLFLAQFFGVDRSTCRSSSLSCWCASLPASARRGCRRVRCR